MADQETANGTARASGMTKWDAVVQVLADKGPDLKPVEICDEVNRRFDLDLGVNTAKSYKRDILMEQAEGKTAKTAATENGDEASAASQGSEAKPAAKQASAAKKTPTAPKAPVVAPPTPAPQSAGVGKGGFSLTDIQAARDLLDRVGAERLKGLIDVLAK